MSAAPCDVLIATHERPEALRALLDSLATTAPAWVHCAIVVDDGDGRAPPLPSYPFPVRHLRPGRRVFISRAKNLGLAAVDTSELLVIDDDNVVTPSTFAHPLGILRRGDGVGAIMPAVLYRDRPELVWVYATPWRPDRWGFVLIGRNRARAPEWEGRLLPTDALPNAAFFSTDRLRRIGGWREELRVNSSADLCHRIKRTGAAVWADSHAFVLHDVESPGHRAFWAAHQVSDPARSEEEIVDWFAWQRGVHERLRAFRARATWHALGFLGPMLVGAAIRPDGRFWRAAPRVVRGVLRGWRESGRRLRPAKAHDRLAQEEVPALPRTAGARDVHPLNPESEPGPEPGREEVAGHVGPGQ